MAHALGLVGERWALLIVRDLLLGPKRFTDLRAGLPGAGPNVVTQRLRELQEAGIVRRRTLAPPAASQVYELTEWGAELEPIVTGLGFWGSRSPVVPRLGEVRPDSLVLSMRAAFAPAGEAWDATVEVEVDRAVFFFRIAGGTLTEVRRGEAPPSPDATIGTGAATLDRLLSGDEDPATAEADGRLRLTGDRQAALRLLAATVAAPAPAGAG